MLIRRDDLCHVNSVTHEGKVVVVATDKKGKLWYIVKQDGFEDSYLTQNPEERTGWENWQREFVMALNPEKNVAAVS